MKKRIYGLLLALCLLLTALPVGANAGNLSAATETRHMVHVNPLYADIIDESELLSPDEESTSEAIASAVSLTEAEVPAYIRSRFRLREETIVFSVPYSGQWPNMTGMFESALVHTGVGDEGDYMQWQFAGWGCDMSTGGGRCTVTYTVTYYTTAAQETAVTTAVNTLLDSLALNGKSDYQKLCAIYDYMCDNITYDNVHVGDSSYKLQFTAYAALVSKTAVCQGYANLFYRLALEAGVDARIIVGEANNGGHAWNIAKLGDKYYNLDSTWDAGRYAYGYFLRGSTVFDRDHYRDPDYTTAAFHAAHPMSATNYVPGCASGHSWNSGVVTTEPKCETAGVRTYYCTVCGERKTERIAALGHLWDEWTVSVAAQPHVDGVLFRSCLRSGCTTTEHVSYSYLSFTDVVDGDYFYDPVVWAVDEGVTAGTSETTFSPENQCTRAQAVTFLWRAAGNPAVAASLSCPFTDVPRDAYYYTAVLWAVNTGITAGTSATTFSPEDTVTRAQVVTFLYRYGGVQVSATNPFTDVATGEYYYNPVLWAVSAGVTAGTSATTFSPDASCIRAQIVTFLYRYMIA